MEPMDPAVFLLPLIPICAFFAIIFILKRWRYLYLSRLGRHNLGFFPSFRALGNALQLLQSFAEPETLHVVEEKMEEDAEVDESGDEKDLDKQLNLSLRKIRRGEAVDRLKVRSGQ